MGARGLGPRKALFDRWLLGFKILQEKKKMKKMNHISISRIARARGSRDQKFELFFQHQVFLREIKIQDSFVLSHSNYEFC